ncbi:MAG: deoxynucleoside kinase [Oscillospiraceae bacterium]|nr:deoxynucleoside kinase [Oscillospiraceae bacterium]
MKSGFYMSGKLIVIEGLDGAGKSTQLKLLSEKLGQNGKNKFITFPDYHSLSGKIISEYLKGTYTGLDEPDSAYSASSFYAVDRYISYKTAWGADFMAGKNIISARYTGSNLIYQMAKLPREKWNDYYEWLSDFEYNKLMLPKADAVIFLDMPLTVSRTLLDKRYEEKGGSKDMHEADISFLEKCRLAADYAIEKDNWLKINCAEDALPRTVEVIHTELLKITEEILNARI